MFFIKEMIYFLRQAQDKLLAQRYISNTNYFFRSVCHAESFSTKLRFLRNDKLSG